MDWVEVAKKLANIGLPILGAAVGGPAGAIAGKGIAAALGLGADATPEQTAAALGNVSGDQLVALKGLETDLAKAKIAAETAQRQEETKQVQAVNQTLQTEAMGGSWLQRNHHAIESLSFVFGVCIGPYFVIPLLRIWWPVLQVPQIPEFVFLAIMAVLGVTAWQRGQANVATAKS